MKITIVSATLLCAFLFNSFGSFAQSDDEYMRFEGVGFSDWGVNYKGKMYHGISRKNTLIAQNCDCKEAEKLFQQARSKYLNGLSAYVITLPVGLSTAVIGMQYFLERESYAGMIGTTLLGVAISVPPIFVIRKSNVLGRKAVREFNKCIDSKGND